MGYKREVLDRLNILQQEAAITLQDFKRKLTEITGKTPRTLRRWYSLDSVIQDTDLKKIALHFGHHENWLKLGENQNQQSMVDQIMASNHFGAVIINDDLTEKMNHKFVEMMGLTIDNVNNPDICKDILSLQSEETVGMCDISSQMAQKRGSYHHTMIMILGDQKQHTVDVTTLNINHGRLLRIIVDKGQVC